MRQVRLNVKLKKSDLDAIINFYSVKKNEFKTTDNPMCYAHNTIKGYNITISLSDIPYMLIVTHSDTSGRITARDVWGKTDDVWTFKERSLPLEQKNEKAELTFYRKEYDKLIHLKDQSQKINDMSDTIRTLTDDNIYLKSQIKILQDKQCAVQDERYDKLLAEYNALLAKWSTVGAPRKLDDIKEFTVCVNQGMDKKEIMHRFGISRATYYRLLQEIKNQ